MITLLLGRYSIPFIWFLKLQATALTHFTFLLYIWPWDQISATTLLQRQNPDALNRQRNGEPPYVPRGKAAFRGKYALVDKYHWWQYESHDSLRLALETQLLDVFSGASLLVTHHSRMCWISALVKKTRTLKEFAVSNHWNDFMSHC